jgi:acyl-CoA thioesterase-1
MKTFPFLTASVLLGCAFLLAGCASHHPGVAEKQSRFGETVVLAGEEPAHLAFSPIVNKPLTVRSSYRTDLPQTTTYEAGHDYIVDYKRGELRRTRESRIPDFRTNMLFGVQDFDHSKYPGFGNSKFFVFVDYGAKTKVHWPIQSAQSSLLAKTQAKLKAGEPVKIVAFGDSITAGGDATEPKLIFWQRWADALQEKYPRAKVQAINGATGGDNTIQGLQRLSEKVISQKPDLVLIGFGMNDHNVAGFGVPVDAFSKNLGTLIDRIRAETGAEVVLYSTFPPNPKWHYGSHKMEVYAAATEAVAREKSCAFADVYNNWNTILAQKKPEDLLANNVNHPNDFGHWIYFQVLNGLGL